MSRLSRILAEKLKDDYQTDGLTVSELSKVFETEPVPLRVFLYDSSYLGMAKQGIQLSPIQFGWVQHFEQIYSPETYIALVEHLGEEFAPVRRVNRVVCAWGKGSSAPYTPVYNARTGQWQRLDSFKAGPVAAAYPSDGKIGTYAGTDSFKEGEGEMFRITTSSGLTEDVWEGHRYLTRPYITVPSGRRHYQKKEIPQWKRLWDLKVGDPIAVACSLPEPTNPLSIPDEIVELVGLFLGDGSACKGSTPMVCGGREAVKTRQRVLDLYTALGFDVRETVREHDGKWTLYGKNHEPSRWKPNPFRAILQRYGLDDRRARAKRLPIEFFSLDNRQTALLLSRLIDTDGTVLWSNTPEISYSTASPQLAQDVRKLFLRLGVPARLSKRTAVPTNSPSPKRRTYYIVRIRRDELVLRLGEQLTLLDKAPILDMVLDKTRNVVRKRTWKDHGDLMWDRIASIEPLGWGEFWTLSVDGPACYVSAGGILSHNSGKDEVARLGIARVADLLLNFRSPQNYYGIPESAEIQALNIAVSSSQAHRAFFRPLRNMMVRSPRFQDQFRGDPPTENSKSIMLRKNIELISGHSQAESQEGLNLIAGIADEIAAFRTEAELVSGSGRVNAQTAEYVLDMMKSSAATRFPEHYKIGIISYPRYEGDAIMKAVEEGLADNEKYGDKSTTYVSGPYATWEVNPIRTREHFAKDYEDDPEYAAAKYECKPPKASDRFLRSDTAIHNAFHREEEPGVEIEYYWGLPEIQPNEHTTPMEGWQTRFYFSPELQPIEGAVYALHGDIALTQDRAGIAMSHVAQWRVSPFANDQEDPRAYVKVDFVAAFEANLGAVNDSGEPEPREVKIAWYRQLIYELISRGFVIGRATFDGFASQDMIQQLNERGIASEVVSLDRTTKVYDTFKATLYDGRIDGPAHELAILEMQQLSRVGKKIDHLPHGSKDFADAIAGSVFGALQEGGSEGDSPTAVDLGFHNALNVDAMYRPVDLGLSPMDYRLSVPDTGQQASNFYGG